MIDWVILCSKVATLYLEDLKMCLLQLSELHNPLEPWHQLKRNISLTVGTYTSERNFIPSFNFRNKVYFLASHNTTNRIILSFDTTEKNIYI